MVVIKGERGSGKTKKLLYYAQGSGAIVIEPTSHMADFVRKMAKDLGLDNVTVISMHELNNPVVSIRHQDKKFVIDEIDAFLANLNVEGYSKTV